MDDNETFRIRHHPRKRVYPAKDAMYHFEIRTADEVAEIMNTSRQNVNLIERSALRKLRKGLKEYYESLG
jgi:DNA-directed RNA polymerase sigma subunit (sigma70/sigma32)